MLKNKFNRQLTGFLTIMLASGLLFPFAKTGQSTFIWLLLSLIVFAALLTLITT